MMAPSLIGMVWMMMESVVEDSVTALIVVRPGPLREGVFCRLEKLVEEGWQ